MENKVAILKYLQSINLLILYMGKLGSEKFTQLLLDSSTNKKEKEIVFGNGKSVEICQNKFRCYQNGRRPVLHGGLCYSPLHKNLEMGIYERRALRMIAVEVIGAIASAITIFSAGIAVGKRLAENNKNDRRQSLERFWQSFLINHYQG